VCGNEVLFLQLTAFPTLTRIKTFFLHLSKANQKPQMNPSPAIGNTTSGIHAGDAVLWAADSIDAPIASRMVGRRQRGFRTLVIANRRQGGALRSFKIQKN
jgi:hypothetical protein